MKECDQCDRELAEGEICYCWLPTANPEEKLALMIRLFEAMIAYTSDTPTVKGVGKLADEFIRESRR